MTCAAVDSKLVSFVGREALMCGLPILFPKKAVYFSIPYIVDDHLVPESCGLVFTPNPKNLAIIINKLHREYEKYHRLFTFKRKNCRQFALQKYSKQAIEWIGDSYKIAIKNHQNI